jgi:hypothetical protein
MNYLADVLHFEQCAGGFSVTSALWAVHIYIDRRLIISIADLGFNPDPNFSIRNQGKKTPDPGSATKNLNTF